jgi:hypothetical protein
MNILKRIVCAASLAGAFAALGGGAASAEEGVPYVIRGSCKLVVSGKTYVDIKKTCTIYMYNDGMGSFMINTDGENDITGYFATLMPFGDGMASGSWNATKGSDQAQALLGEDFKQKGGCWSNKKATICAFK